jgi:hypothetical protein
VFKLSWAVVADILLIQYPVALLVKLIVLASGLIHRLYPVCAPFVVLTIGLPVPLANAVSGVVDGVKAVVYNALPLITRRFDILPEKYLSLAVSFLPIYQVLLVVKLVVYDP